MSDSTDLITDILQSIKESTRIILERISEAPDAAYFIKHREGSKLLDSIAMRLQFVGESLKKVEKIDPEFLAKYPNVEWSKIMNLRDFISHHYEMLNHEIIFDICSEKIPELDGVIAKILKEIS